MGLSVIDYSARAKGVPEPRRGGKFIHVRLSVPTKTDYIIMAPREMAVFHANIAKMFFEDQGIVGTYNHKRDNYTIAHPDWDILGGGHWEMDEDAGVLELSGKSLAYGRFHSSGLARRVERAMPDTTVRVLP